MSIHNPVGDTYFTILLRTHPGRWGKSSSSQSIGTSRPGSHSGEATSDSNAQAGGSSLRLSTGGVHRLSSLLQTLSEGDNIGYVPGQETAGLVVLYPRPVTPSTTYCTVVLLYSRAPKLPKLESFHFGNFQELTGSFQAPFWRVWKFPQGERKFPYLPEYIVVVFIIV